MARKDYEVDVKEYPGLDVLKIASEELQAAALDGMNKWKENLDSGSGATGSHRHGAYRDRGEAVADVTISPQTPDSLDYEVGGDVVQLAVAEFGRTPGSMPPWDPIAEWAHRKGFTSSGTDPGGMSDEDLAFVQGTRLAIMARGLEGFAPGLKALQESADGIEDRVLDRIDRELTKK